MTHAEREERLEEFHERNARQILDLLLPAVKAGLVKVGPGKMIDPESAVTFLRESKEYWELMALAQIELLEIHGRNVTAH